MSRNRGMSFYFKKILFFKENLKLLGGLSLHPETVTIKIERRYWVFFKVINKNSILRSVDDKYKVI